MLLKSFAVLISELVVLHQQVSRLSASLRPGMTSLLKVANVQIAFFKLPLDYIRLSLMYVLSWINAGLKRYVSSIEQKCSLKHLPLIFQ